MSFLNKQETELEKEKRLIEYQGDDKVISSKEALEKIKTRGDIFSFKSKIPSLDKYTEGFEVGELIVITGTTKHGKTLFCETLTRQFEQQDIKCLWFEFEIPERQFLSNFSNLPLFYLPSQLRNKDINWIKNRILEGILKYSTRIVFIDELHFVIDMYSRSFSLDIGQAMRDLKRFAIDNEIVLFVVAHTAKMELGKIPTEEDIRDSSFIPQIADSTIVVWREIKQKKYTGYTKVIIRNHRRTGVMAKDFKMMYKDGYLEELNEELDNMISPPDDDIQINYH